MSLIERAISEVKQDKGSRDRKGEGQATAQNKPVASDTAIELDRDTLAENGFIVPSDKPQRLPQEMRAIKRRLLRRLKFYKSDRAAPGRPLRNKAGKNSVVVTSTSPDEGKTFTAINLALSLALEDNVKVLLIDADVPRPMVLQHLGLGSGPGLTDLIAEPDLKVEDLVLSDKESCLKILTEGTRTVQGSDFFAQPELGETIRSIANAYRDHVVIIDAPPVLAAPGTSLLAQYADEVVFIVRANKTPEPAAVAALDEVLEYNEQVSLILNYSLIPGKYSHYGSYGEYYYQGQNKDE